MRYELLNGNNLAYIGDAYYELQIRNYLLSKNITKGSDLRKISLRYVSAHAQASIYEGLKEELTEEEINIFHRGRNSVKAVHRKNIDLGEYVIASGYEAIIGYLYLKKDNKRLDYLINKSLEIVEESLN